MRQNDFFGVKRADLVNFSHLYKGIHMNFEQNLEKSGLDLTVNQLRSFFLGGLSAKTPLDLNKALEEIFSEEPEARAALEPQINELYLNLKVTHKSELGDLISEDLETSFENLDFFLTGLSIAGTHPDSVEGEYRDILEDLEDLVMDLEEYLETQNEEEKEELTNALLGTWEAFLTQLN